MKTATKVIIGGAVALGAVVAWRLYSASKQTILPASVVPAQVPAAANTLANQQILKAQEVTASKAMLPPVSNPVLVAQQPYYAPKTIAVPTVVKPVETITIYNNTTTTTIDKVKALNKELQYV